MARKTKSHCSRCFAPIARRMTCIAGIVLFSVAVTGCNSTTRVQDDGSAGSGNEGGAGPGNEGGAGPGNDGARSDGAAAADHRVGDSARMGDLGLVNEGICAAAGDAPVKDLTKAQAYAKTATDMFHALKSYYQDIAKLATIVSGGSNTIDDLYNLENVFHGMLGVYEVTRDESLLSELLDLTMQVVAAGKDVNGDGYLDYCCRADNGTPIVCAFDDDQKRKCDYEAGMMPTYPWRALRETAAMLRAVAGSSLATSRKTDFDKLRQFVRHDLIDKWLDLDGAGPDTGLRGTDTPGILARMSGMMTDYYLATGDTAIGTLARDWVVRISQDMEPSKSVASAYFFDNDLRTSYGSPADVPHANEVVVALIEGVEAGFLSCDFLAPLQETFLKVMWNQASTNPLFSGYVDGSGTKAANPVVAGFIRLAQFKGATQALAAKIQYHSSGDYDTIQYNGNMCRAYGLALRQLPLRPLAGR